MENREHQHVGDDGIDRRGMLKCMAWVGTGLLWTLNGGIAAARVFGRDAQQAGPNDFSFVQISDSHIGFSKEPNKDVTATFREAIARINDLPQAPAFVLHTGDLTHLSKPGEFDTVAEVLKALSSSGFLVQAPAPPEPVEFDAELARLAELLEADEY